MPRDGAAHGDRTGAGERRAPWWLRLWPHALLCALIIGIAASGSLDGSVGPGAGVVSIAATGAALVLGAARRPAAALLVLAVAVGVAGWAWGAARVATTEPAPLLAEGAAEGELTLLEAPIPTARGARARAEVGTLVIDGRPALEPGARVLLDFGPQPARVEEGARVSARGDLASAVEETTPGWWRRWLARNRIAARLSVAEIDVTGRRGGLWGIRGRWRTWARATAGGGLHGDTGALVRGMLLGGGSELSERVNDEFRDAGIWHLLAVSGQNVTVVAVAVLAGLRALAIGRRPALVVAGLAIGAYCLACEGGPSVARSGLMGALGLSAGLAGLPRRRWYLALLSLAIVLAVRPRDIADPGLQLSFAAVAGLYSIAPLVADRLEGLLPRRIAELVGTALAAGLATAPILAWHFGRLSIVGLALNVVAVPLAGPIVVIALAGVAASPLGPLAHVPTLVAGVGADVLLISARIASAVPGASVTVPRASAFALGGVAVATPALLVLLGRRVRPVRVGRPHRASAVAAGLVLVGLVCVLLWPRTPGTAPPEGATASVSVLDVGQGQAVLVRVAGGRAVLIDAGPPGTPAPAASALEDARVSHLDAVLVSHDALDHSGGLESVLERLSVDRVLAPASAPEALATARRLGVPATPVAQGHRVRLGASALAVHWPPRTIRVSDPNDASLVVELRGPGLSALVPGDAESPILGRLPLDPVGVLVLAHHGSADPGLERLLARLRPRVAVASAGEGNSYGHPADSTVAAVTASGTRLLRTDRDGTVTVWGLASGGA